MPAVPNLTVLASDDPSGSFWRSGAGFSVQTESGCAQRADHLQKRLGQSQLANHWLANWRLGNILDIGVEGR